MSISAEIRGHVFVTVTKDFDVTLNKNMSPFKFWIYIHGIRVSCDLGICVNIAVEIVLMRITRRNEGNAFLVGYIFIE